MSERAHTYARAIRSRWQIALVVIVAAALLLRVGAVVVTNDSYRPGYDSGDFDRIGVAIAETGGYPAAGTIVPGGGPSAFRPPALSYLLGASYALTGTDDEGRRWLAARVLEAIFGGLAAAAAGVLAFLLGGPVAALIAALLVTVDPTLVMLSMSLLTEPPFILLMLSAFAAVVLYRRDPRLRWAAAAGVLAGCAALTRSNGLIVVMVAGVAAIGVASGRRDLRGVVVIALTAALVMAPWTVRNAIEMDAFVPVTTASGFTAAGLYNSEARASRARWQPPRAAVDSFARAHPDGGELAQSESLGADAQRFIRDSPDYLGEVAFWNSLRLLGVLEPELDRDLQEGEAISTRAAFAGVYGSWIFVPLIVVGLGIGGARRLPAFLWVAALLLAAGAIFLGGGNARYRAPIEALLIVGAALGYARKLESGSGSALRQSRAAEGA